MSSRYVKGKLTITLRAEYEVVIDDPHDIIRKRIKQDEDNSDVDKWNQSVQTIRGVCQVAKVMHEKGLSTRVNLRPISIEGYQCGIVLGD